MATWAEFERDAPELAAFGLARLEGRVVYLATLRRDGSPRVHPVSPWIGAGLLMVLFRGHSPKVAEVARDSRYAMHTSGPSDDHDGVAGEFLVSGWLESVGRDHPAASASPYGRGAPYPLAYFACHIEEAVGTTYEKDVPVYRRWRG
jgi:hypothetical protein